MKTTTKKSARIQHRNVGKSLTTQLKRFIVNRFQQNTLLITKKTTNVKTPHFYVTPKVHKKDISGRPVVSSVECHTSKLCKFVDHYLDPHAKALSYVDGTTDFISKLEKIYQKTLYTNIPNYEGIEAVKEAPNNQVKKPTVTRVKFLHLILALNNFHDC